MSAPTEEKSCQAALNDTTPRPPNLKNTWDYDTFKEGFTVSENKWVFCSAAQVSFGVTGGG